MTTTIIMCGGAAFCATILGVIAGSILGHAEWPGRHAVRILLMFPALVPPYLHAIAWTGLLRVNGPITQFLAIRVGVSPTWPTEAIHSVAGAVLIYTLTYFPLAMLMTEKAMFAIPRSLSDAAKVYGASSWQEWRHAVWPGVRPAAATSVLIVFLMTNSELGVPTILRVPAFNFEIFTQLSAFNDLHSATLLCVPLLFVGLVLVLGEYQFGNRANGERPDLDYSSAKRVTFRQSWVFSMPLLLCATVSVIVPLTALIANSLDWEAIRSMASLALRPTLNTYVYSTAASLMCLLSTFMLAVATRSAKGWMRHSTDILLIPAFAIPSAVLALSLLGQYGSDSFARTIPASWPLVAALFVRYQIVSFRGLSQSLAQIPGELFESSAIDGANPIQEFRHVIFPELRLPALLIAAMLFMIMSMELGSTILLYPPGGETLPIALYSIEANSPRAYVAGLSLIVIGVLLLPLAIVTAGVTIIWQLRR